MEPITLCGMVIVVFGLWIEFEGIAVRVAKVIAHSIMTMKIEPPVAVERPHYVKYLAGA